jgi:iron complex outermembrane receptor protein
LSSKIRNILVKGSFWITNCLLLITIMVINSVSAEGQKTERDPGKIVITDEDIKKMNIHSVVDLLNQIPGVSATKTSISFRGSSIKNILVLLDGRAINNPASSYRAVNWDMVSINTIEKIEIYKGTGSVLYGDDTSGGVVSITTKKIARESRGNIEVSYGRFDSQKYDLNYQKDLGNLGLGLSAGWEKEYGFRINSDEDNKRIGTKLSYKLDQKKNVVFSFDYSQFEKGSPGPTYSPSPRARSREKDWGSTFILPLGQLISTTHYSAFDKRYNNPDTGLDNIMESWVLNERLSSPVSAGRLGQFNIGTDLEIANVEGNNITSQQEEKYAFYVIKDVRLQKTPLNLGLGIRANFYSDFPTAINPQVQLSYKRDDFDIHLSASRSNNIPTFYQRYYETSTLKPNPDLGMEKAMNYSLSLSYRPKETLEGSISFFLNDINERITYVREDSIGRYSNG